MKKNLLFILFITLSLLENTYSQNTQGPGGVGTTTGTANDLHLWLQSEIDLTYSSGTVVSQWNDQSGFGNNATEGVISQQPIENTGIINGFSVVRFDGTDDKLSTSVFPTLTQKDYTLFFVWKNISATLNHQSVYVSSTTNLITNAYFSYNAIGSTFNYRGDNPTQQTVETNARLSNFNITTVKRGDLGTSSKIDFWVDAHQKFNGNKPSNWAQDFSIHRFGTGGTRFLGYDLVEAVIIYQDLNLAKRTIIQNYLSAKYNIGLDANGNSIVNEASGDDKFYREDNPLRGNFDFNVAGIGRASDGSFHIDSQGTGIIKINDPSTLSTNDYLFWGEDVKNSPYDFSIASDYLERLNTTWRVTKTNDLGAVTLAVQASELDLSGLESCSSLKLIVSSTSTFAVKTTYNLTLSGGFYTANSVNFTDGDYFTLEYQDLIVLDGTTAYLGSGALNVPDTTDDCYKLLVKASADGTPSLTENADVREVEVEAGGILLLDDGIRLQVTNGINNNGEIRAAGKSQILQTHSGATQVTGTGNLFMDQFSFISTFYNSGYWSSPVNTDNIAGTFTINGVLKDGVTPTSSVSNPPNINFTTDHDGPPTSPVTLSSFWLAKLVNDTDWDRHRNENTSYNITEGWNMKGSAAVGGQRFTFKGIINDGDYSSTIDQDRLSLIGNPYPSAMAADQFIIDNLSDIDGTLYFYDDSGVFETSHVRNTYSGGYGTRAIGIGTPFGAGFKTPGAFIAVGQAFFVTRSAAGTGTINFTNSHRVFETLGGSNVLIGKNNSTKHTITKSKGTTGFPILRIGMEFVVNESTNQKFKRHLAVGFRGLTTSFENGYDAEMFERKPSDFALKVEDRTTPFVISSIQNFNNDIVIPLEVYIEDENRNVTFSLIALENITTDVYLKDTLDNKYYNLSNGETSMNLDTGIYKNRFFITFKNGTLDVNDNELLQKDVTIFSDIDTKEIVIKTNRSLVLKKVALFTVLGQKITSWKDLKNSENRLKISNLANAIYIVKLFTDKGTISKKIMIEY